MQKQNRTKRHLYQWKNKRHKYRFMWLQSSEICHNYVLAKGPTSL